MPQDDSSQSTRTADEAREPSGSSRASDGTRVRINVRVKAPELEERVKSFTAWPSKKKEVEQNEAR